MNGTLSEIPEGQYICMWELEDVEVYLPHTTHPSPQVKEKGVSPSSHTVTKFVQSQLLSIQTHNAVYFVLVPLSSD